MGNNYINYLIMIAFKRFLLLSGSCFFFLSSAYSQTYDKNGDEIPYNIYKLPSIEISTGVLTFFGDVNDFNKNVPFIGKHNFGVGASIQQRIGSFLGVSAGFLKGKLTGFDTRPGSYYNFQTDIIHGDFNIYLHLDNDFILNKSSRFAPYLKAGVGYLQFNPMGDLKDKNGKRYYYWRDGTIRDQEFDPENPQNGNIIVRDYSFETKLDSLNLHKHSTITVPVGGGIKFKLSDAFEAKLDLSYVFTSSDYVDNLTYDNKSYPLFDRRNDNFLYSSVSLQFNIGSIAKHIQNNKPYRNINFATIDAMDADKDGVPDKDDLCPFTPTGVKVDKNGCPLDDDNDGVPNYLDKEPNTAPGSIVDAFGVTITPEMIEAKYIRDSLLMAGELILEKKYSEGTPVLTEDYSTGGSGTVYTHVTYPYVKANWPDNVKSIPVNTTGAHAKTGTHAKTNATPNYTKSTSVAETNGVVYKVQIGASQKPLEASFFKDKFNVSDEVSVEQTGEWYKYTVGNFKSYKAARDYTLKQSNVEGAFVVKYENGKRVLPTGVTTTEPNEVIAPKTSKTTKTTFTEPVTTKGIFFRVQIGSSANKLSPTFFKDNFGISDYIYEEQVDGQYKYTVGHFNSYKEAKKYTETITSVQGAFVTSYKDDVRIPLQDAININNNVKE